MPTLTARPASGHKHSGRAAGVAVELFTASASQRAVLRSYGDSKTRRLGREPEGNALHPSWQRVGSRVGPREPQSALLRARLPRDPRPWWPRSHLLAAHGCEDLRAAHGRPGSLLRDPESGDRSVHRWTARSVSALSELGALASLPHVLLSNKLAGSTSGHL